MEDIEDFETWIIDTGDTVIRKEASEGTGNLTDAECAAYDLWAVDYAVRNAGDMRALKEMRPKAAKDLSAFLKKTGHADLAASMLKLGKSGEDCDLYYDLFEQLCTAVNRSLVRT